MKKKLQITILFGTEKDVKKTYVFENETQDVVSKLTDTTPGSV